MVEQWINLFSRLKGARHRGCQEHVSNTTLKTNLTLTKCLEGLQIFYSRTWQ